MKNSTKSNLAKISLFIAAIIWGSSFLIVKNSMDVMQPHMLLAFRFTIGAVLLAVIFYKRLLVINKDYLLRGICIGACLFLGYSLQTIGITDTTPGKNAFLTAVYCVLVPFFFWAVDKKKPNIHQIAAALITIVGIGFVSLNGGFSIRMGDSLTLISGIFYALHVVSIAKLGRDRDPIVLTILQFAFAGVFSWIITFLFEDVPTVWTAGSISSLLYLAVFATAVAILLQNVGQKYTNPSAASIILSLEAVFGVLFSVIFYHEKVTARLLIGFSLIFIAVILSETKFSFLKIKRKDKQINEEIIDNEIYEA